MDFFNSTELSIPVIQMVLLLVLSTLALLFGRTKLALLINFLFTIYWGYFLNIDQLTDSGLQGIDTYAAIYFGIGLLIVIFALVGFLRQE
jgi:hypothetical protein